MKREVKEEFCEKYCRYPKILNQEELDKECDNCPINLEEEGENEAM